MASTRLLIDHNLVQPNRVNQIRLSRPIGAPTRHGCLADRTQGIFWINRTGLDLQARRKPVTLALVA